MSRVPWNNISDSVQGGSAQPEWWLSNFGQVAQGKPEYSSKKFCIYFNNTFLSVDIDSMKQTE